MLLCLCLTCCLYGIEWAGLSLLKIQFIGDKRIFLYLKLANVKYFSYLCGGLCVRAYNK